MSWRIQVCEHSCRWLHKVKELEKKIFIARLHGLAVKEKTTHCVQCKRLVPYLELGDELKGWGEWLSFMEDLYRKETEGERTLNELNT